MRFLVSLFLVMFLLTLAGCTDDCGDGCCKYCKDSKPCGDSCIPKTSTCHQPQGCAC